MIDWAHLEFGIAAAISCDTTVLAATSSGHAYLGFATVAGVVEARQAAADCSEDVRGRFKACALGVQYGIWAERLGRQLGLPIVEARRLTALYRKSFHWFRSWSENFEEHGLLVSEQRSVSGWRLLTVATVTELSGKYDLRTLERQSQGTQCGCMPPDACLALLQRFAIDT